MLATEKAAGLPMHNAEEYRPRHAAWTTIQNPTPEELEELFGDAS